MRKPTKAGPKTLFILKKRAASYEDGNPYSVSLKSSGLLNSAHFVYDMLVKNGREAKLVEVVDNNDIDREVTLYRPTTVIIEALWVIPAKFEILRLRHPTVQWVIRSHSELPFGAGEGITMQWFFGYMQQANVSVAFNTRRTTEEFRLLCSLANPKFKARDVKNKVWYLPNYYPVTGPIEPYHLIQGGTLKVGCFGAIRPLKNQLIQAVAAISFAENNGYKLEFHVNGSRVEGNASSHKKNLLSLFANLPKDRFSLVQHDWLSHKEFSTLVRSMDIGLQVSFTESFNIVAADFVNAGIPVVVSSEISWVSPFFYADCTSSDSIEDVMGKALRYKRWFTPLIDVNRERLRRYSEAAKTYWLPWT
jgi:glycosyltransferase involved in cell wall biosynthesis